MLTRRAFLLGGAGAAGALVIGWAWLPPRQRLAGGEPLAVRDGQVALNGWVKVASDNTVTVVMNKAEMGQGVHTGAAMLLAEEMEADWSQIRVEPSPVDNLYNNIEGVVANLPFRPDDKGWPRRAAEWFTRKGVREVGLMFTGGSTSIRDLWTPMREAGAAARMMLCAAAAKQWDVKAEACRAQAGKVVHPSGRSATFGELAAAAAREPLPRQVELKDPASYRLIGTRAARLDAAAKLHGTASFGIDVVADAMVYASVQMCPTLGGTLQGSPPDDVKKLPGVLDVVALPPLQGGSGGVAVIASDAWIAMQAVEKVQCKWDEGGARTLSSDGIRDTLVKALDASNPRVWYEHGNGRAMKQGKPAIQVLYSAPYLAHAALEPVNCTVLVQEDRAIVWAATQMPGLARRCVAKTLRLDTDKVELRQQSIGGAFGRRLEVDFICQAAAIAAQRKGVPVQTIWSRPEDMRHDFYRPASVSRFEAWLDGNRKVIAVRNISASQSVLEGVAKRNFGLPDIFVSRLDKSTVEGAFDQAYDWPDVWVGHQTVDLAIPVGYWRSVGHSHHAFFMESFVDELAVAVGVDPLDYRMSLLRDERQRAVLEQARKMSGWGQPLRKQPGVVKVGRGVALHESFGSVVAQVAEVSVDNAGQVRVDRVYCAIDCGMPVNPTLIEQQVEGGIVFGLSAALWQKITLKAGKVQEDYYTAFPAMRLRDCPDIQVHVMPSMRSPQGVGESTTPPIAPAVANALFHATGERLRDLPLLKTLPPSGACDARQSDQCQR
jgi:isoquinoline 1-oxidoreductase beta subunit